MRLFLFIVPVCLFSSDASSTDIIPRTINFLIFFSLLVYFLSTHIKNFYYGRLNKIANRLEEAQSYVLEMNMKKEQAVQKLEKAKQQADSIVINAKQQADVFSKAMEEDLQKELLSLQKSYEEQKVYMQRKMKLEVVGDVVDKIFDSKETELSQDDLIKMIIKKVS